MTGHGQKLLDGMVMQLLCNWGLKRCWMTVTTIWKQTWKSSSVSPLWGTDNAPCWLLGGVWSNSLIGCFYWRSPQTFHRLPNSSAKWDCLKSINFSFLLRFPLYPPCPRAQTLLPLLACVHSSAGTSALSDASLPCFCHMQTSVYSFLILSPWKVKVANVLFYGQL